MIPRDRCSNYRSFVKVRAQAINREAHAVSGRTVRKISTTREVHQLIETVNKR